MDLIKAKEKNFSVSGDILIARVGQRMIGRVGILSGKSVLTNESIFTLRILDKKIRMFVYNVLKTSFFHSWCKTSARGTANYFITKNDLKNFISLLIKNIK
jgi:restriction endonuclease S subunit